MLVVSHQGSWSTSEAGLTSGVTAAPSTGSMNMANTAILNQSIRTRRMTSPFTETMLLTLWVPPSRFESDPTEVAAGAKTAAD